MEGDSLWQEVQVRGEPAGEGPDSGRVAWFLEWTDRWGHCRRLLYGYGPGARRNARAVADRIAGSAEERSPSVVVTIDPENRCGNNGP
jgi:hypothetical protein